MWSCFSSTPTPYPYDCRSSEIQYGQIYMFLHGVKCSSCKERVLHPADDAYNRKHIEQCRNRYFEKKCSICLEVVKEKQDRRTQRFGVMSNCKHCFCLDCIMQWRAEETLSEQVVKACPECRTHSDYVVPSVCWPEDDEEKERLVENYRAAAGRKHCKHFAQGTRECPFGNQCFYKHELADGQPAPSVCPRELQARRQRRRLSVQFARQLRTADPAELDRLFAALHLADSDDDQYDDHVSFSTRRRHGDWTELDAVANALAHLARPSDAAPSTDAQIQPLNGRDDDADDAWLAVWDEFYAAERR